MAMHPPRSDSRVRSLMERRDDGFPAEWAVYQTLEQTFASDDGYEVGWSVPTCNGNREIDFLVVSKWNGLALLEVKGMRLCPRISGDDWEWCVLDQSGTVEAPYDRQAPDGQMEATLSYFRETLGENGFETFQPTILQVLVLPETSRQDWALVMARLPIRVVPIKNGPELHLPMFGNAVICMREDLPHLSAIIRILLNKASNRRRKPKVGFFWKPCHKKFWHSRERFLSFAGHRAHAGEAKQQSPHSETSVPFRGGAVMPVRPVTAKMIVIPPTPYHSFSGLMPRGQLVETGNRQAGAGRLIKMAALIGSVFVGFWLKDAFFTPPASSPPSSSVTSQRATPAPDDQQGRNPSPASEPQKPHDKPQKHKAPVKQMVAFAAATNATPVADPLGRTCYLQSFPGVIDGQTVQLKRKLCLVNGDLKAVAD